jgi:CubicO group peptidase (beta-lactamase class C family)
MTVGFADPNSIGKPPPVEIKLREGMASEPGQIFACDDGATQLPSAILTKATGMTALEFANEHLFGPLGISTVWWTEDDAGHSVGGHGLTMTPRDMANGGSRLSMRIPPISQQVAAVSSSISCRTWILWSPSPRAIIGTMARTKTSWARSSSQPF